MLDLFVADAPARRRSASLYAQLRDAITGGRLAAGDRLPTSRELADELRLSRSTVTTVYGQLVAEGFAAARRGDGTFVAGPLDAGGGAAANTAPRRRSPGRPWATVAPLSHPPDGWAADLRTGRPDPALFPVVEWRRSVLAALQTAPPGYGERPGLPALRRAIASWVGRSRGVVASPDDVIVTSGSQGAFDLCARALLGTGGVVAVENPGYPNARNTLAHGGTRVVPVAVDDEGLVVDRLPDQARLVYVTPSHQAPTGVVMSPGRRQALLAAVASSGAAVIEDDYDTEYRYVDRPLEPLHRLDTSGRVVYVGSFSKTLTPSLRLGFVVAPPALTGDLLATQALADSHPPHLTQAALAHFITTGGFERHLRRSRRAYRSRRELVLDRAAELRAAGLVTRHSSCPAGLHVTLELGAGTDAGAIASRLHEVGVAIDTTDEHWVGRHPPGLIVGFGLAAPTELAHGLDTLAAVLRRA